MDILTRIQKLVEQRKEEGFNPDFIRRNVSLVIRNERITDASSLRLIDEAVNHYLKDYTPPPVERW